eukprot:2156804-Rhodomonas_salina.1
MSEYPCPSTLLAARFGVLTELVALPVEDALHSSVPVGDSYLQAIAMRLSPDHQDSQLPLHHQH